MKRVIPDTARMIKKLSPEIDLIFDLDFNFRFGKISLRLVDLLFIFQTRINKRNMLNISQLPRIQP
jgi:hypothetical protein